MKEFINMVVKVELKTDQGIDFIVEPCNQLDKISISIDGIKAIVAIDDLKLAIRKISLK